MTNAAQDNDNGSPTGSAIREVVNALAFSMSVNLSDKHAITMQTHLAQDASAEQVDALLNMLSDRADRLIARYRFRDLCKFLGMKVRQYRHMVEDIARIDAKHREHWKSGKKHGEFKLTNQQEAERNNAMLTRMRTLEELREATSEASMLGEICDESIPKDLWDKLEAVQKAGDGGGGSIT